MGLVSFFCFSLCNAQTVQQTPNLIAPSGWQGCLTQYNGFIWGGTSGGPCPVQRSGDGAILFSYGQSTLSQTIAVNKALSGSGVQVQGYDYSWTLKNANAGSAQNPSYDPLTIDVTMTDSTGKQVEYKRFDYSYRINDWTTFSGKETYKNPYALSNLGNLGIAITSKDAGYWAGYYGPEINNVSLRLNYGVDPCVGNPLYSTSCPGYQQAYFEQQCSISALYNTSCPGYQQAYLTQQCSMNALFNPTCPGYQQAYQMQQCSLNPLFNPTCPGYQQAFLDQQCRLNSLYSPSCPGYADAYKAKLAADACSANPQSSPTCKGYVAPVTITTTTTTTSITTTIAPTTQDPVSQITKVQPSSDPIVNQVLDKPIQKVEEVPQQTASQQKDTKTEPQTQSRQTTAQQQPRTPREAAMQAANQRRLEAEAQQKQQAVAALGVNPSFAVYEAVRLPDVPFYRTEDIYRRASISDNANALRQLNQRSDRIHREMVDEQYRR